MKETRRRLDILVLSDIHLGTYGCHAKELLQYLRTVKPKTVILNGDIIDIWQFSKRYFPKSHFKVIKHLIGWIGKGVKTYYVTGNHDELFRRFEGLKLGSLKIVNKVVLELDDGKKAWFFHGDVFDVTMQHSKWLVRLGSIGYDLLILINRFVNFISQKILKKGKLSLSKKIKDSVKRAVSYINQFEEVTADIGITNKYEYVVCGHIHQPVIREIKKDQGSIIYMNSGDWIENLSALEYVDGQWSIYKFNEKETLSSLEDVEEDRKLNYHELFGTMLQDFNKMKSV
ncbi:MAG: UDP-2,3-diacylglucosamine diphosphatase [Bacteroidales bacterium]|nr:UDP-2,3-diacylglucosamine diphosphatase [Bacteroidales bacterium]